ncbi:MAG: hypothetical protein FWB99_02570 [Treponema sp.]|nr:hypothetical protein [Treponema sp.]
METTDTPEKGKPIQWHPAFFQAIKLELDEYRHVLEFIYDYQLTTGPQRIDVVVIKKTENIHIKKNFAAIFRKDNLLEYKSPDEYISVKDFYKVYGYACQYIQLEENKEVDISDLTLSFVESRYPQELIKHLTEKRNFTVEERCPGIYTVEGDIIPIQLIDSRKLSAEENLWLKELDNRLTALQMRRLTEEIWRLGNAAQIAAYINAIMQANQKSLEEMYKMSDSALTLDEVFVKVGAAARWEARGKAEGKAEGRAEGKTEIARNALSKGLSPEMIRDITGLDLETIKAMNK